MSFKLATSHAISMKAGINANSKVTSSGAIMAQYSDEAEAFINLYTRYNFTNTPNTLFAAASGSLQEAASNLAAIQVVLHDQTTYQPGEAENIINTLNYKAFRVLDLIKEDVFRKFAISGTTGAS